MFALDDFQAGIEQSADREGVKERCNSRLQLFCLLLCFEITGSFHKSSFFLVLLVFSQIPIYQKAKGFSIFYPIFRWLLYIFCHALPTPKVEVSGAIIRELAGDKL